MAFTATITMNDGESFTATGISFRQDTGKLEFTGASGLTSRSTLGLRVDSATAGGATMDHVVSVTVV